MPPTEVSHSDESPLTDQDVLSSDSPNVDSQQANPDVQSSNQDTTTAATQERRGVSEVGGKLCSSFSMYIFVLEAWTVGAFLCCCTDGLGSLHLCVIVILTCRH